MIVSLRLDSTEMPTDRDSLDSDYVLVAVRLMRITILAETQMQYYSKPHWGKSDHGSVVYMTSEIYAKIYGLPPVLCSKYLLKEVCG